ncbi:hypothetical protein JR316_0001026 [Psilocybe cubensis]|uniref:Uncharacterized protein n=2 Tax=Psilocybe cubensis TaxID=181762 RepID=A0ACB8HGY4_PSICU|nr:hypothetical protein JR316_0001026 [Psilocybe cubensis]KAH9486960.1 hypothetical protein JR316_0001026 [Psilocybe cubensis]
MALSSKENSFFSNVGAVASVFILAGLVATSIVLWIIFAMRRRRRTRRLEHDTAVSASLAAAGLYRTPLDEDDDERGNDTAVGLYNSGHGLTENPLHVGSISSLPSVPRTSTIHHDTTSGETDEFALNPFEEIDFIVPSRARDGYVTGNGLEFAGTEANMHSQESNITSNTEPLLTAYRRTSLLNPAPPNIPLVSTDSGIVGDDFSLSPSSSINPIRYPSLCSSSQGHGSTHRNKSHDISDERLIELNTPSDTSVYSNNGSLLDDRLDPGLRQRLQRTTSDKSELRDEEDYSRPIFGVCVQLSI